jgi:hypothetical protein
MEVSSYTKNSTRVKEAFATGKQNKCWQYGFQLPVIVYRGE